MSFKYGNGERSDNGRKFTDVDEKLLESIIDRVNGISISKIWLSEDNRPDRNNDWLNALLLKSE